MNPLRAFRAFCCLLFSANRQRESVSRFSSRAFWKVFPLLTLLVGASAAQAQIAGKNPAAEPSAGASNPGQVQAMKLLAPGVGWVLQQNRLYLTRNNGQDWADITPFTSSQRIEDVFFVNSFSGWVIGLDANPAGGGRALQIASTSDAGRNWRFTRIDTPGTTNLQIYASTRSMFFLDSKRGWIILQFQSGSNFSLGLLLSTDDGGLTWKERPSPPVAGSIRFLTAEKGWLAEGPAAENLWFTGDGGTSWERKTASIPAECGGCRVEYSLPTFQDQKNGFLSVVIHSVDRPYLAAYSTHDGGKSWQAGNLFEHDSSSAESSIGSHMIRAFSSSDHTLTLQYDGDSVRTAIPQTLSLGRPVWVDFADSQNGWIVWSTKNCLDTSSPCSQQQELLSTTDAGRTLRIITPRTASGTAGFSKDIDLLTSNSASSAGAVSEQLGFGTQVDISPEISDLALTQSTGPVLSAMQKGFDMYSCINPTLLQSVWSNSSNPYRNIGVYIGGCDVHCVPPTGIDSCGANVPVCIISSDGTTCTYPKTGNVKPVSTHLHSSDLSTVLVHWGIIPIWVGAQAPSPCTDPKISVFLIGNSPQSLGAAEADQAMARANSLGISGIIYYDMEYYVPGYTACSEAVVSFLQGWVNELQSHGYKAGIYVHNLNKADFSNMSPKPDSIWVADWGSNASSTPTTITATWINQYCNDGTVNSGTVSNGKKCPDAIQQGANWIDPVVGAQVDEDMINGYVIASGGTASLPDLTVTAVTIPSSATVGGTVALSATILNQGNAAAGAFSLGFYLSPSSSITTSSTYIAVCSFTGLAASASSGCSGSVPLPSSLGAGTYYGGAIVDNQSQVKESNEGNNTLLASNTLIITKTASPAITVTPGSIAFGSVAVGSSATQNFTVQNNGSGTLTGNASVSAPFSISSGGSYSLTAGASQSVGVTFSPTSAQSYNQSVTFSGGAGATANVTGTGTQTQTTVNLGATTTCHGSSPEIDLSFSVSGGTETTFDLYRNGTLLYPSNPGTTFSNYGSLTAGQSYSYYVVVHLSGGGTATSNTVYATAPSNCAPLTITSTGFNPPTATVGVGYAAQQAMAATGGTLPYSWSIISGQPNGMAINASTGALYGTPTSAGTFYINVGVGDSSNPQQTNSRVLTLTVNSAGCGQTFCPGDVVMVYGSGGLNLRSCASTSCGVVTVMPDGTSMQVIGGPSASGGITWWNLSGYPNGVFSTGWASGAYLKK